MLGLILVVVSMPVLAQKLSIDNGILLDSTRPSVYLEGSEVISNASEESEIWLRLYNNSKDAISIPTESMYIGEKVKPLTLRNGKGVLAIRSGTVVAPCYVVEGASGPSFDGRSWIISSQFYQRLPLGKACTVRSTTWIASGESVRLMIPLKYLSSGRRIGIAFEYEWENAQNIEHWIYFSNPNNP